MQTDKKQKLARILEEIQKRYDSIFFSKLVLFDRKEEVFDGHIYHYDTQRSAASDIFDTLQSKISNFQLKSLHMIKICAQRSTKNNSNTANKENQNEREIRSFFPKNMNKTMSIVNIIKPKASFKETLLSEASEMSSMSVLASKIRRIQENINSSQKTEIEKSATQEETSKIQKRQLILAKMDELEDDLTAYLETEKNEMIEAASISLKVQVLNSISVPVEIEKKTKKSELTKKPLDRERGRIENKENSGIKI